MSTCNKFDDGADKNDGDNESIKKRNDDDVHEDGYFSMCLPDKENINLKSRPKSTSCLCKTKYGSGKNIVFNSSSVSGLVPSQCKDDQAMRSEEEGERTSWHIMTEEGAMFEKVTLNTEEVSSGEVHFELGPPSDSSSTAANPLPSKDFSFSSGCSLSAPNLTSQPSSSTAKIVKHQQKEVTIAVNPKKKKPSSWYNMLNPTYKSRSEDFKKLFIDLPQDERLIVEYSSALQKDILVHGRLYMTRHHLCFYANIFGWETSVALAWKDVVAITREKTALVIPNAIQVTTRNDERLFFTSFAAREKAYTMLLKLWRNSLFDQPTSSAKIWQWVHSSYGDELGLTSDDEVDYVAPVGLGTSHSSSISDSFIGNPSISQVSTGRNIDSGEGDADSNLPSIGEEDTKKVSHQRQEKKDKKAVVSLTNYNNDNINSVGVPVLASMAPFVDNSIDDEDSCHPPTEDMEEQDSVLKHNSIAAKSCRNSNRLKKDFVAGLSSDHIISSPPSTWKYGSRKIKSLDPSNISTDSDSNPETKSDLTRVGMRNIFPGHLRPKSPVLLSSMNLLNQQSTILGALAAWRAKEEGREMLSQVFPVSVDLLFTMLFTNSKFYMDFHASRKTFDIVSSDWIATEGGNKVREVSFTLSLTHPMGPKHSHVTDSQTLKCDSQPGQIYFIDVNTVNAGIPYADSFNVTTRFCLSRCLQDYEDSSGGTKSCRQEKSRLTIISDIKYKKTVLGLVKIFIEKNTWIGLEDFYSNLARAITDECMSRDQKKKVVESWSSSRLTKRTSKSRSKKTNSVGDSDVGRATRGCSDERVGERQASLRPASKVADQRGIFPKCSEKSSELLRTAIESNLVNAKSGPSTHWLNQGMILINVVSLFFTFLLLANLVLFSKLVEMEAKLSAKHEVSDGDTMKKVMVESVENPWTRTILPGDEARDPTTSTEWLKLLHRQEVELSNLHSILRTVTNLLKQTETSLVDLHRQIQQSLLDNLETTCDADTQNGECGSMDMSGKS